jgi:hypothetical protein
MDCRRIERKRIDMSIKVIVVGDSHSYGDELWEEKHIAGYSDMSHDEAFKHLNIKQTTISERKDLTYVGYIKQLKPDWEVFNFSKSSPSQSTIAAAAYSSYSRLKHVYPDDQFICIIQDTYRVQYTYWSKKSAQFEGLNFNYLDLHLNNHPETKDLVKFAKRFLNEENLGTQYYAQALGVLEFFRMNSVPTIHFNFYNHRNVYKNDTVNSNLGIMRDEYLKGLTLFPNGAIERMCEYYGVSNKEVKLPGYHIKHKYQEIIGKDIVDYIDNNLLSS